MLLPLRRVSIHNQEEFQVLPATYSFVNVAEKEKTKQQIIAHLAVVELVFVQTYRNNVYFSHS